MASDRMTAAETPPRSFGREWWPRLSTVATVRPVQPAFQAEDERLKHALSGRPFSVNGILPIETVCPRWNGLRAPTAGTSTECSNALAMR